MPGDVRVIALTRHVLFFHIECTEVAIDVLGQAPDT